MTHTTQLPRSTPEAQGIPSAAVTAFLEASQEQDLELHSLMIVRHGAVVAEGWWHPYAPDTVHLLYSLSKSFTATAVGLAVAEGRLSVDDPVLTFFPDEAPAEPHPNLQKMRVRDLLNMATGHVGDTIERFGGQRDWVRGFLALPPEREPGTVFAYNQGATLTLAAIVHKVTGEGLLEYLRPRLLDPLGITKAHWLRTPTGLEQGFSGLHSTTEAVARFGQLYLQRGRWEGRQLLPESWIDEATRWLVLPSAETRPIDWSQGYGYQFWRCRHGAYRGDGAFGQFCVVMPEQDAVLALTGAVEDMQPVLDLVWAHLLPAMGDARLEDERAHAALTERLEHLHLPPVEGDETAPAEDEILGKTYRFSASGSAPELLALTLNRTESGWNLTLRGADGDHQVGCGYGAWQGGETAFPNPGPTPFQVRSPEPVPTWTSGAWTGPDIFTFKLYFSETPHALTFTCRFGEAGLRLERRWNVQFGELELPVLTGTPLS